MLVLAGVIFSGVAISQNIKLNPIKPGAKSLASISDEQQGILAVRKAKASVVSIFGEQTVLEINGVPAALEPVAGTGVIISSDGLVVTNSHVVNKEKVQYRVVLGSGQEYPAKILGLDKYTEVALLKIQAQNLPAAVLGNSETLETGQTVFAIGNSLGKYQNTVSRGVVSGIGRAVDIGSEENPKPRLLDLIQTDAAISPGNSGGPLVNMAGEVIGINTLIELTGQSLGFAVPINAVKQSVDQLKSFGKVSKPHLGVTYQTINNAVRILRRFDAKEGAFVLQVADIGPAGRAGILPGDIITEVNREALSQKNELDFVITKYRAGDTVLITFLRAGERMETPVLLGEFK